MHIQSYISIYRQSYLINLTELNQTCVTVTTSTLELEPPSSITTMHFLSLPLALSLQLFLLWLLGYLDPLLGSNSWVLSSSSFLDAITVYKMAISELYFQTCFAFIIKLALFVTSFGCFIGVSEQFQWY
jgi:hypothetical protein